MKNAVVIKGNKAGMTVYLDPELPFEELLEAVAKKFQKTAKFWGAAQMTLTLEGRSLTPREERVITLRFGLEDGRARTLEELGKEFNVTRERVRQIEAKALRKLRHPSRSKKLKDYLE